MVVASPAYLAARGAPQSPHDLAAHDCISFDNPMTADAWAFRIGTADVSVPVRSRLVVNGAEAAVDAALAGVGLARVISYQTAPALRGGTLRVLLREFETPPAPAHLVHRGGRLLPLKLRAFLDFATPRLRAALTESAVQTI